MSSKTQYRDALKHANRTIVDLKAEIQRQKNIIAMYETPIERAIQRTIEAEKKKWWQFWK